MRGDLGFRLCNVLSDHSAATVFHSWGRIYLEIAEFCKRFFLQMGRGGGHISDVTLFHFKVVTVICLIKKNHMGRGSLRYELFSRKNAFPFTDPSPTHQGIHAMYLKMKQL